MIPELIPELTTNILQALSSIIVINSLVLPRAAGNTEGTYDLDVMPVTFL